MHPRLSYLICATPRTGSYLLCEALMNTNLAGHPTEYFFPNQELILCKHWKLSNYADYLAKILETCATPNGVFGAKLMWLNFDAFVNRLQQIPGYGERFASNLLPTIFPNLHYVWITRRNKVRQAVSYWKALQTRSWVHPAITLPWAVEQPTFHFKAIDRLVQEITEAEDAWQKYFYTAGIQPYTVVYEELVPAYEETALQILRYLDIPVPSNLVFNERYMKRQSDTVSEEWVQHYHYCKQHGSDF